MIILSKATITYSQWQARSILRTCQNFRNIYGLSLIRSCASQVISLDAFWFTLVGSMKAILILFPLALHVSASILHKQEMINSYMYPLLQDTVSHNIMCVEGTNKVQKESISTSSWRLWYKLNKQSQQTHTVSSLKQNTHAGTLNPNISCSF